MKSKIIIFGAGYYGTNAYYKLKDRYQIVCFADNNSSIIGKEKCGIPVVGIEQLKEYDMLTTDIVICVREYNPICNQLLDMGITSYYIMLEGFLFHTDLQETMFPIEIEEHGYYRKEQNEKNILFVQRAACIRTHKIASVMKGRGYKVFLLYTVAPPLDDNKSFAEIYDQMWDFSTMNGIKKFIQNSDFDVVHCSNEPDMLANIANMTSKPIVFDTHDMQSIRGTVNIEQIVLEYCANTYSDGNLYTSDGVPEIAKAKYNLDPEKIFTLDNMILDEVPCTYKTKLSSIDGEVHCVYEGGIEGRDKGHHRYFEDIWMKLVDCGIHIHFYSQSDEAYCKKLADKSPYLHYEGHLGSQDLINEMTQYDCGLAVFNVNERNRAFLETGTANKVFEYLNSGIPVLVGDIHSYDQFVTKFGVGERVDLRGDIRKQVEKVCSIEIPKNILKQNKLTMMSKGEELEKFYERIIEQSKVK